MDQRSNDLDGTTIEHRVDAEGADYLTLAGVNDAHLQELAKLPNCRVILRGDHLILSGELSDVERTVPVAEKLVNLARTGQSIDTDDVRRAFRSQSNGKREGGASAARSDESQVLLAGLRKLIAS